MLILFRPFKVGDQVTAGGVSGTVKAISVFNTELATPDNQQVLIPNSSIMSNIITNITANPTRRIDLLVNIGYGDDIARARETLTRACSRKTAESWRNPPRPSPFSNWAPPASTWRCGPG